MSCHAAAGELKDNESLNAVANSYCGGMTELRVLAPSETADELSRLRKLADRGVAADQNEPFGDQTWVELNAGNAWLITAGEAEMTGTALIATLVSVGLLATALVCDAAGRGGADHHGLVPWRSSGCAPSGGPRRIGTGARVVPDGP